ncbi:hypothetical protein BVC80_1441g3 [Macleaya cordata]|uniref:Uncharacterized protein n=1 Tax=Macleaya cordata TaxID=56857 RepID=A0A200RB79_MACCD|nr:hypothetical protein BVC80_1441g3 [Macleaya cordata]
MFVLRSLLPLRFALPSSFFRPSHFYPSYLIISSLSKSTKSSNCYHLNQPTRFNEFGVDGGTAAEAFGPKYAVFCFDCREVLRSLET